MTIGHSTRDLGGFVEMLRAHGVSLVADVRAFPRSRHNPQFDSETLAHSLAAHGIGYLHLPELGGRRRRRADSPNAGWRNASFRAFADYMETPEFERSLEALSSLAGQERVALMCAEAVPWRCHRSLIADALVVRGFAVEHILSPGRAYRHVLTPWAQVSGTRLTYPSSP